MHVVDKRAVKWNHAMRRRFRSRFGRRLDAPVAICRTCGLLFVAPTAHRCQCKVGSARAVYVQGQVGGRA